MKRFSGSSQSPDRKDQTFKVELPDRNSTVSPLQTGQFSPQKSPVSPQSDPVSSPGLESLRDIVDEKGEYPIADQPEKEYYPPDDSAPEVHQRPVEKPRKDKRWLFWVIALVACTVIGLGVGLGVGLTRHEG